jgi:hypothetical protein
MTANTYFVCPSCKKYLKDPITLPCGDALCKDHVDDKATTLTCPECQEEHAVPKSGFRVNKRLLSFLNSGSHLTARQKEVQVLIDRLENVVDNFEKSDLSRSQLYIHEHFAETTNQIDIHRETMIQSIENRSEKILTGLNGIRNMRHEAIQNNADNSNQPDDLNALKRAILQNEVLFKEMHTKELGKLVIKPFLKMTLNSGRLIKGIIMDRLDLVPFCIEQIEDSDRIITCGGKSKEIRIWSTISGYPIKSLWGHTNKVTRLVISNDKKYFISGSLDGTLGVWYFNNDFQFSKFLYQKTGVMRLCLLPNNILVCGLADGKIAKWNLNNFTKIDSFKAHKEAILGHKHVSSSQVVSCSISRTIKLWNIETNECLRTFCRHRDKVNCIEVSADGSKLYSGSMDKSVRVWDISSGVHLAKISFPSFVYCLKLISSEFLAVGCLYIRGANENPFIIDLNHYTQVNTPSLWFSNESIISLNFDQKEKRLLIGREDRTIKICQF